MDTSGGKLRWDGDGGVLNWVIGIDMYKVMCIKLLTDLKKNTLVGYSSILLEYYY